MLAILVAVALSAATVLAIRHGEFDGNRHPYVGLMVAQAADGTPLWRCSGTLLSPTLFLTAGHCAEAPAAPTTSFGARRSGRPPSISRST